MDTESADRNRPAFVRLIDKRNEYWISSCIVARLGDLECDWCIGCGRGFNTPDITDEPGKPPVFDYDFIRNRVYASDHPSRFSLRVVWAKGHDCEVYPLSDEDVEFFKPYIDAIERVYARK